MTTYVYACTCGAELDAVALVAAVRTYSAQQGLCGAICPRCGSGIELCIRPGMIGYGYTYWAGSMHFEEVGVLRVHGLRFEEDPERDVMILALDGAPRELVVAPALGYVPLQAGDHGVGRSLETLALEAFGVEVRGLQAPGYVALSLDRKRPISVGTTVELFGALSARRRAERYLRHGR